MPVTQYSGQKRYHWGLLAATLDPGLETLSQRSKAESGRECTCLLTSGCTHAHTHLHKHRKAQTHKATPWLTSVNRGGPQAVVPHQEALTFTQGTYTGLRLSPPSRTGTRMTTDFHSAVGSGQDTRRATSALYTAETGQQMTFLPSLLVL